MKRTFAALSLAGLFLASCSSGDEETVPVVSGPDPTIVVTVDCGDDGVASVRSEYGTGEPREELIGRNPTTQSTGASSTYSNRFGVSEGSTEEANLKIVTSPTRGTCTTTLTNDDGGDVVAERESAGTVTLEAVIRGE